MKEISDKGARDLVLIIISFESVKFTKNKSDFLPCHSAEVSR